MTIGCCGAPRRPRRRAAAVLKILNPSCGHREVLRQWHWHWHGLRVAQSESLCTSSSNTRAQGPDRLVGRPLSPFISVSPKYEKKLFDFDPIRFKTKNTCHKFKKCLLNIWKNNIKKLLCCWELQFLFHQRKALSLSRDCLASRPCKTKVNNIFNSWSLGKTKETIFSSPVQRKDLSGSFFRKWNEMSAGMMTWFCSDAGF